MRDVRQALVDELLSRASNKARNLNQVNATPSPHLSAKSRLPQPQPGRPGYNLTPTTHELQSAILFVLALYASMALLNVGTEWTTLVRHWQTFIDFLAAHLLVS
jgi:hypothetical protein